MNTEACFGPSHARAARVGSARPGVVSPRGVSTPITVAGSATTSAKLPATKHSTKRPSSSTTTTHPVFAPSRPSTRTCEPAAISRRGVDTLTISTLKLRFGPEKSTCSPGLFPMMSLPSGDESDSTS